MEIRISKQAQAILEQKINELANAGFLVKKPEIDVYTSPISEIGDSLNKVNIAVKINVEMFVPDKFLKVEL